MKTSMALPPTHSQNHSSGQLLRRYPTTAMMMMMMKSSTFSPLPYLSLSLSVAEPTWSFLSFTPLDPRRCSSTHNTPAFRGLIASISHRELFTKFCVLRNHVKKKIRKKKKKSTPNSSPGNDLGDWSTLPPRSSIRTTRSFINVNKPRRQLIPSFRARTSASFSSLFVFVFARHLFSPWPRHEYFASTYIYS